MVGKKHPPMRVLIADNETEVRESLRLICEESLNLSVVGEASDSDSLISLFKTIPADIALLDWDLPKLPPLHLIDVLKADPLLHIIVIGKHPEIRLLALEAGADGFVYKGDPPDELLKLLRQFNEASSE